MNKNTQDALSRLRRAADEGRDHSMIRAELSSLEACLAVEEEERKMENDAAESRLRPAGLGAPGPGAIDPDALTVTTIDEDGKVTEEPAVVEETETPKKGKRK